MVQTALTSYIVSVITSAPGIALRRCLDQIYTLGAAFSIALKVRVAFSSAQYIGVAFSITLNVRVAFRPQPSSKF